MTIELSLVSAVMRTFWNTPRGRLPLVCTLALLVFLSAKPSKDEAFELLPLPPLLPLLLLLVPAAPPLADDWVFAVPPLALPEPFEPLPKLLVVFKLERALFVPGASCFAAVSDAVLPPRPTKIAFKIFAIFGALPYSRR